MYRAGPPGRARRAVLVLHSCWGLTADFERYVDALAAEGFLALAPDLLGGRFAGTVDEARLLMRMRPAQPAYRVLDRAIADLLADGRESICVVGFCLGARWACRLACRTGLPITLVVLYYGLCGTDLAGSRASFLVHRADRSPQLSEATVRRFSLAAARAGRPLRLEPYPRTAHWFAEGGRPEYDPVAATAAWRRTVEFLEAAA